ncbi:peptide ABC transporter substrate-binding protein [Trichocoleus sp. FACHB-591]|uniref:ABC transporter substrate-binding protein n=1 Tax=Trichocoleus sp. FACHB-591 TaxID=2692872 RepID=UPI00168210D3|nr:ABC transporter substrate-binding protein [Trichocoleus sp. FACHB-591]MBD2098881.1 peptide ABC transporter substrate-binding protein [Trichocoleus sp. FACHB-591]
MNWLSLSVRQWRSLGKFLGLFSLCCFLAISCASRQATQPTGSPAANSTGDRIVLGTTAKVRTLDPADAYDIWAGNLLYNLGDRLYTYEAGTTNLKPQLATALPQVSEDGLTYKIPLRQGVVFHDGTPFNAEAMAFSLRRFIENGGQPSFLLSDTVESVTATGESELTIQLKKPFAAFPNLLAFSGTVAVSPKAYEVGQGKFKPATFVGTGPYKLAQYGTDSLKLDVFDQYWGEKPANQGVDIQNLSSPANLYNAFQTGSVDVAYQNLDLDQVRSLQQGAQRSGWQVIEGRGDGIYYLTLNLQDKPLDQALVRQAIAALIDRPLLQQRVFQGQVEPLYSLIPTTLDSYSPVFQQAYGDGNIAKVQELLTKAGYSKDKPLQLELWYRSNLTSNELVATTLKALAAQKLGGVMTIELKSVESATAYQNLDKGAYPMFILDWAPDFLDADNYIQPFLACAKGSETTGCQEGASKGQGSFYYSDRINQLIDQERQERNPQARQKIFGEIQELLVKDVPFIPLWQNKEYLFVQKGISGARLEATQKVPFSSLKKG